MNRSTIFLSHAAPEDNDFTDWLAAKLTLMGYTVWHDLGRLKGGDLFWSKIEAAIRNDTIRFVAIVSEVSYKKDGVRNEWALAATIEKTIPGFVIPIRLDGFDFNRLPITIHQKNVIDFCCGWHHGLTQLLDTLSEANIANSNSVDPVMAKGWMVQSADDAIVKTDRPETLESNWLPILSLPSTMETAKILFSSRQIPVTSTNRLLPWFELGDHIIGFAPGAALVEMFKESVPLRVVTAVDTESFVNEGTMWNHQRITVGDARNRAAYLIRQAWDLAMERTGLRPYELSNHRLIWYVPTGLIPKDKVEFIEASGKRRKKKLCGESEKLNVNWHYAVSMRPVFNSPRRIELGAHIVFTDMDGCLVQSVERMHRLRRRFCKNWWNDRWRGFLRAFLALVAQGGDAILLPVGGDRSIRVGAFPLTFNALNGLSDVVDLAEDDDVELDENDDLIELPEDDAVFIDKIQEIHER
ncbi:TIR domain-containing protein [Nitrosospira briensis]|uniref:TIR domain-containing protein n=1 Tax=Nitrosospira briensis TaxID=35799 RepID=A0A1I4XGK2_9PROT|nr:toll/interleukin-1 receptor domain-containing protein [Nitrosospira briensis]SFN25038.1 TIR domain-containing protein [Nitrosospira briensis]